MVYKGLLSADSLLKSRMQSGHAQYLINDMVCVSLTELISNLGKTLQCAKK